MENTAKIYIMGGAAVLVSGVKLEDWKLVEKYMPEALKIVNEDEEPVFKIKTGTGGGSINQYGIVWGSYLGDEGQSTVTVLLDDEITDKKQAVSEIMGAALLDLMTIESEIPKLLEEIHQKETEIDAQIIVI